MLGLRQHVRLYRQLHRLLPGHQLLGAAARAKFSTTESACSAMTSSGDIIIQHLLLRTDLRDPNWTAGALITQCCHASVAAIVQHAADPHVVEYVRALKTMHKVTVEVSSEQALLDISAKLTEDKIAHHLWYEQPENIPTCIATKPIPKNMVPKYLKRLPLLKVMPTPATTTTPTPTTATAAAAAATTTPTTATAAAGEITSSMAGIRASAANSVSSSSSTTTNSQAKAAGGA